MSSISDTFAVRTRIRDLAREFGGVTFKSSATGVWWNAVGERVDDVHTVFSIAVALDRERVLIDKVLALAREMGEQEVFYEIGEARIERV